MSHLNSGLRESLADALTNARRLRAAREKELSERTNEEILSAVIADLAAMPPRTFSNEATHQRVIADLRHLRARGAA